MYLFTCTLIEYRYEIGGFASNGQVMVSAVVNAFLLRVVVLEEQNDIVVLVEGRQRREAGVRGKHLQENVPGVHVL